MRKDNYVVQAWTADWNDRRTFPTVFKGTEQECLEFCKQIFIEAAHLLIPGCEDECELSLGFDPYGGSMRVVEITLYGRNAYEGLSYTRYYSIDYDWRNR